METQLSRLSAVVKSYQGEREQLRQALMTGCAERQQLQQQVQELTARLQAAQARQPQGGHRDDEALGRAYWGSLS
jgi:chromosome segregation ATPase